MSETTNQQVSPKVTTALLDRMYNNFVKITDWVIKGKESKYPLPKALSWLFTTTETNEQAIAELIALVTTLQQNLVEKEQSLQTLQNKLALQDKTLQVLQQILAEPIAPAPVAPAPVAPAPVAPTPAEPVAPAPVAPAPMIDELVDLDDVTTPASPNEQAIQVSAEAVGAGQLDPASYQALDAEIASLLG